VSDRARPAIDTDHAQRVYIALLRSATSGRQSDEVFRRNLEAARTLASDDESYFARQVRGNTMHHREWLGLNEECHRMRLTWAEFFKDFDLLLCPAAASAAFPHNHVGERWEQTITVNGREVPSTD
jgi:amidase